MSIRTMLLEAGKVLKQRYAENPRHSVKERFHLLSEVDQEIDRFLCDALQAEYPHCSICSEESTHGEDRQRARWIVDPIDGTTNFIMGNPFFAISVALEMNGEIVEGHVYNPVTDEYFQATENDPGALFNGMPIAVNTTDRLADALVAFGYSANIKIIERYYEKWTTVFDGCGKGIGWVAPALSICNVARGRVDAFIDSGSSVFGQSAAGHILKNAGGVLFNEDYSSYRHDTTGGIFCSRAIAEDLRRACKAQQKN